MKNKLLLSGIVCVLTFLPIVSSAETVSVSVQAKVGTSTEARLKAKAEFEVRQKELEERKEALKSEMEQKRNSLKTEMEAKVGSVKNEIENKQEDIKNKIEDRKETALVNIQERLDKFVSNVKERFNAAIERLEKLAVRIDARITKMEAENIDVAKAKELSVIAKIKIETAKTSVAGINLEAGAVASSTATSTAAFKADFEKLKVQVEKAKEDVKAAHAALVEVVASLKSGIKVNATGAATTTVSTP